MLAPAARARARETRRRRRRCATSSATQRMPVIIGSSHSSKYTLRPPRQSARPRATSAMCASRALRIRLGFLVRADQRAEPADVVEDAFDAAMVADPHLDAGAISSRAMSAWMSEKPIARSGSSSRISSIFALVNAETFGFSLRARGGRTVKPEMPTMRCSSPSAYSTSVGSSVRQTMRCGKPSHQCPARSPTLR